MRKEEVDSVDVDVPKCEMLSRARKCARLFVCLSFLSLSPPPPAPFHGVLKNIYIKEIKTTYFRASTVAYIVVHEENTKVSASESNKKCII